MESSQAVALSEFLKDRAKQLSERPTTNPTRDEADRARNEAGKCIVKKVMIGNCAMRDADFAKILEGVKEQKELRELTYTNNFFGAKSLGELTAILNNASSGVFLRSL